MNAIDLEHYNLRRGARSRKNGESDAIYDVYGIKTAAYRIVLASMAHYRCFGVPPMRQDLQSVGIDTEATAEAIRTRFLEETPLRALRPTKKAWKEFGFFTTMRPDEICAECAER